MAKGPAWSDWEDSVLEAARQINIAYQRIVLVMPHRSAEACKVRANILRRERGVPSRDYAHLDQLRWRLQAAQGSRRLAEAMSEYGGRNA